LWYPVITVLPNQEYHRASNLPRRGKRITKIIKQILSTFLLSSEKMCECGAGTLIKNKTKSLFIPLE
jgi:hypothetical protein